MNLDGQRVLVTGASGFLGRNLCHRLVEHGAEVHGTSRLQQFDDFIHWHRTDWSSLEQIRHTLSSVRPDVVINLAGHVSALPDAALVKLTFDSLLSLTVNLLLASTEVGVRRLITVGSVEEPDTLHDAPTSPYGAAKAAATLYCKMFHELYRTPVVVLRPSLTFGPRQDDQKLLPYVIRCAVEGRSPTLSSGNRLADWTYIDDVTDGFLAAITATDIEGMTFEIGTGNLRTTRSMVEELLGILGNSVTPSFGVVPDRPGEKPRATLTAAASKHLGWSAATPLSDALRWTADWYVARFNANTSSKLKTFCSMLLSVV